MKNLLAHAAASLPFPCWLKLLGQPVFLPFYHLVSDDAPAHVRHLYPVRTVRQFRNDLDFLLRHFEPIDLTQLWAQVFEKKPFRRPSFHLTFDDGLRECHDVVMPVLLEKGIPATFFLNPDFIDNRDLMYRYKASLLCASEVTLPGNPLAVNYHNRHLLDVWAEIAGLDFAAYCREQKPYLDSHQIRVLQTKGFSIGAHSLDHPQYNQLTLDQQLAQTEGSLLDIQNRFAPAFHTFAFPFTDHGVSLQFFERLRQNSGSPVLTFGSAGVKRDQIPTHLQRFAMERSALPARSAVAGEFAYSFFRKIAGRQTVKHPATTPIVFSGKQQKS